MTAVRTGSYSIDPHAVAAAILGRHDAPVLTEVLEALERDSVAVAVEDDDAGAGADLA